jgi:hypothetical protein
VFHVFLPQGSNGTLPWTPDFFLIVQPPHRDQRTTNLQRVWFINPCRKGAPGGFVVSPHELVAGVNVLVCHETMLELGIVALPLPLLIDTFPVVGLDPPRHLAILRRKPQLTLFVR